MKRDNSKVNILLKNDEFYQLEIPFDKFQDSKKEKNHEISKVLNNNMHLKVNECEASKIRTINCQIYLMDRIEEYIINLASPFDKKEIYSKLLELGKKFDESDYIENLIEICKEWEQKVNINIYSINEALIYLDFESISFLINNLEIFVTDEIEEENIEYSDLIKEAYENFNDEDNNS